jgi:L1 cell adhesion molecule like protein
MPRGQPQIEVSFDMDSNGILTVSATEKSSGKSTNIKITNDKGRLSQEEIDRMVEEAEKYKEQDEELRMKIDAKNGLDGYLFQIKDSLKDKTISSELQEKMDDAQSLLDKPIASKEEYSAIQEVLKDLFMKEMVKDETANANAEPSTSTSTSTSEEPTNEKPYIDIADVD